MELLCEEFIENKISLKSEINNNREYLMDIWFSGPQNKMKVTRVEDLTVSVDILPYNLKMKMLSANDQRIVKVFFFSEN